MSLSGISDLPPWKSTPTVYLLWKIWPALPPPTPPKNLNLPYTPSGISDLHPPKNLHLLYTPSGKSDMHLPKNLHLLYTPSGKSDLPPDGKTTWDLE